MSEKRNALFDLTRVIAAVGIILSHVDLTSYGAWGALAGQFLSVRFPLMFFLAIIGFYVEKSCLTGKSPIRKRVLSLTRIYGVWSLVYLALSFTMLVLIQKMPLGAYISSRVKSFFFSGSYYHFWFYPAVIYALLVIGGVKKILGNSALHFLTPLSLLLYTVGLLGTGYLPIGQKIPFLHYLYACKEFEAIMHLFFLGLPSVVFGMAAAHGTRKPSGRWVLAAAILYAAESIILCLLLGWRENPQMLISTPFLTVLFLKWAQNSHLGETRFNTALLRTVSAGMYNVHPLILAAFAIAAPALSGPAAFLVCTVLSVFFGWMLYRLRKIRIISLFI
ncbi:MAG: hypothetical protein IIW08_03440 [Clostridia bacterium]|nr:hypothetical protein [Clostridia bacterium]